jgi:class 3 adenylate cyclase
MSEPLEKKSLVALMFTDLVGSVALQQRLGTAAYMRYVSRHDRIFQECLADVAKARVLNESGDGFLVCFDDPSDAVRMALRLQFRLHSELSEGEHFRVRIGLHLGVVTEMGKGMRGEKRAVGMPINLTARIMDLADGGQILTTRAIHEDVRNHVREHPILPDEARTPELRWLSHGFYEFKGSPEPMELFEIGAEGIAPFLPPEETAKAKKVSSGGESADRAGPEAAQVEVLDPETVKDSDVFICHAPIDDAPMEVGGEGWVTQFHRNLEVRLEQLLGRPVRVWRDTGPRDPKREKKILSFLPDAKSMVSVISPPFVHAEDCIREVTEFEKTDPGSVRLISAEKTPVDTGEMPAEFARLFSEAAPFTFYEREPGTGRIREFDGAYGESSRQHFFERIYDIAYELKQRLKARADSTSMSPVGGGGISVEGKTVYVAEATSDLKRNRDQLRRELFESGYRVLPEQPLPRTAGELNAVVREYLAESDLAIHLVGNLYGLIPEDASHSVVELQNMAGARAHDETGLPRFIWSPREVAPQDERQAQFLKRLDEDPEIHRGAEVIRDTMENLSSLALEKLAPDPEPEETVAPAAAGAPPSVYLIFDQRDEEAVEPIEDFLFDNGLEVITPHFDGDETEVSRAHRQSLLRCDAVLVYYGQASKTWVEMQMMDVVQAPGYGRKVPMRAQAVLIAGPEDRRKERFRTHLGDVIRTDVDDPASAPGALAPFISHIVEGKEGHHV